MSLESEKLQRIADEKDLCRQDIEAVSPLHHQLNALAFLAGKIVDDYDETRVNTILAYIETRRVACHNKIALINDCSTLEELHVLL